MQETKVSVYRSQGQGGTYVSYNVPWASGMTVLDVILFIQRSLDPSLAFRYECRQGICGTCAVMYNDSPVLSCSTQLDKSAKIHKIGPLANFPVEKDLIVDLTGILSRYNRIKPYMDKFHEVLLDKKMADASKPFRKCIECGCCIAGSPTIKKEGSDALDPMSLVKIARYLTDPRDRGKRTPLAFTHGVTSYTEREVKKLSSLCPRGIPIDTALEIVKRDKKLS